MLHGFNIELKYNILGMVIFQHDRTIDVHCWTESLTLWKTQIVPQMSGF